MVKFNYLHDDKRHVTVAREVSDGALRVAYSVCHPNDQFSKKLGRTIATGRLKKEHYWAELKEDDRPLVVAMKLLANGGEHSVRKMANEWLSEKTE